MATDDDLFPNTVIVTLPGAQDVLRIPPLDSRELKAERIARFHLQSHFTPLPEPLRWLPQIVNWLDDAQDILITALGLGYLFLRKTLTRFIPYVGWALLVNDVLNIFTQMFSAPLVPRGRKADFLRTSRRAVAGRKARILAAEAFLLPGRFKWIPFALQAGQVLDTFTGWGLQLGGIMGAASEIIWGRIAQIQGSRLIIKGPPPSDIAGKASRFLVQSYNWWAANYLCNAREIQLLLAADNIAKSVLGAPHTIAIDDDRCSALADFRVPVYDAWVESTERELAAYGAAPIDQQRTAIPTDAPNPSHGGATRAAIASIPDLDIQLATKIHGAFYDWPNGLIATEAAQSTWDAFGGGFNAVIPMNSPLERMLGFALEAGLVPPFMAYPVTSDMRARYLRGGRCADNPVMFPPLRDPGPCPPEGARGPITYPSPSPDPGITIVHWCAVALALWCRRPIPLPLYQYVSAINDFRIVGWFKNTSKPQNPMIDASRLVFGEVYIRYNLPENAGDPAAWVPGDETGPFRRDCFPGVGPYPSLSGRSPELDAFRILLDTLPTMDSPPDAIGQRRSQVHVPLDRTWLDQYMREATDFRQTHPELYGSWADQPTPLDSDPNPADDTRYARPTPSE